MVPVRVCIETGAQGEGTGGGTGQAPARASRPRSDRRVRAGAGPGRRSPRVPVGTRGGGRRLQTASGRTRHGTRRYLGQRRRQRQGAGCSAAMSVCPSRSLLPSPRSFPLVLRTPLRGRRGTRLCHRRSRLKRVSGPRSLPLLPAPGALAPWHRGLPGSSAAPTKDSISVTLKQAHRELLTNGTAWQLGQPRRARPRRAGDGPEHRGQGRPARPGGPPRREQASAVRDTCRPRLPSRSPAAPPA